MKSIKSSNNLLFAFKKSNYYKKKKYSLLFKMKNSTKWRIKQKKN